MIAAELASRLGADVLERRPAHDLWPWTLMRERAGVAPPEVLVVRPRTQAEAARVVQLCAERGQVLVPLGGGSGVCGAVSPGAEDLVLDLGGLDRIVAIDTANLACRVEAGVNGAHLEAELGARGLTLGHVPSSLPVSTVGGLVSTRSSGQESSFFGNPEDMLLGAVVAAPDGQLLPLRPGPRSAVGPALHQLLVGAEGALGVLLEVELRVHRRPAAVHGGGFVFPDLDSGWAALRELHQRGLRPLVARLYDPEDTAFQGLGVDGCLLILAVAGEPALAAAAKGVADAITAGARGLGEEPWQHWLEHRFDLSTERLRAFLAPPGAYVDTIEVACPWSSLADVYARVKAALVATAGFALCHFSHGSPQGCCAYFTFAGTAASEAEAEGRYWSAWEAAMAAAMAGGATISHHHGVGRLRARWARQELGPWWDVWTRLRDALDPAGILNPNAMGGR